MYLLVLFSPLLSFIFSLLFGRLIGNYGVSLLSICALFISMLQALYVYYEVSLCGYLCFIDLYKYIDLGYLNINIAFFFDVLTSAMIIVVIMVSFLVHIYSIEYMSGDPCFNRFMGYLSIFTFFMLLLVTADNFMQMFIGWEGVGLSSYLLISFWYSRILANKAAIKAMLINRIGDFGLLIAISLIFFIFSSLKYNVIFNLCFYYDYYKIFFLWKNFDLFFIIGFFLFLGAMGKSAQLGLHIWLPDAMEGPTPVSALIHAATMVTAGVFLVVRCSFIFELNNNLLLFVCIIGGFTCFFSSILGAFQFDIKKIVAYSTCSQLGYMFFSSGLSNYGISFFHLFNHAFFKALLFLSMGSIIHALFDEQDFRKMGGLVRLLPFTYIMVIIGSLSLMGFPFLTGFYSKDFLLELAYSRFGISSKFFYFLGLIAAFFTAFYSIRLIYWVFLSRPNFYKNYAFYIHEPKNFMFFSMFILGFASIFVGYFFFESFNGIGTLFFNNSIYINLLNYSLFDAEFGLFFVKYMALIISLIGILLFFLFIINYKYFIFIYFNDYINMLIKFFFKLLYFDLFFIDTLFFFLLKISYLYIYKYVEKRMFEFIFIFYIIFMFYKFYFFFKLYNLGLIFNFVFLIIFFFIYFFLIFELLFFFEIIFVNIIFIMFIINLNINEK